MGYTQRIDIEIRAGFLISSYFINFITVSYKP